MNMEQINDTREEEGAIGIGAMIVFIALVLVAAVASSVIIQTAEKLQQNAQQTGQDTKEEIGGKITILSVHIVTDADENSAADADGQGGNADDQGIKISFELSPGSETITAAKIAYQIFCATSAEAMGLVEGVLSAGGQDVGAIALDDSTKTAVTSLSVGTTYYTSIVTEESAGTECDPTANEDHTLYFHVEGGGTTYETLSYKGVVTAGTFVV